MAKTTEFVFEIVYIVNIVVKIIEQKDYMLIPSCKIAYFDLNSSTGMVGCSGGGWILVTGISLFISLYFFDFFVNDEKNLLQIFFLGLLPGV